MEKLSTFGNVGGLDAHVERTMLVPNADPELSKFNKRMVGSGNLVADIKARHLAVGYGQDGKEIRKNAVLANEFILTASHEAFPFFKGEDGTLRGFEKEQINNWHIFKASSLKFLQDRYGKENVVNFTVHMDEETPHIHAVVVPIVDGKLNSRALFHGREKLRELQTDFAAVMEPIGLKRGILGSKVRHTTRKEFYSELQKDAAKAEIAMNNIDSNTPKIVFKDVTLYNGEAWVKGQEKAVNSTIQGYVERIVHPVLKNAVKIGSERDSLLKENAEMREDLRNLLKQNIITPEIREKYIPDVLREEKRLHQAELKKANDILEMAAKETTVATIKAHQLGDGLRMYDINRMIRGEKVEIRIDRLILYLAWDKIEGKVKETCFFGNEQAALFEKYKNGTLDLMKDDGKSRGVSR